MWKVELKAPFTGLIPSYYETTGTPISDYNSSIFYGANSQFSIINGSLNILNPDFFTQGKSSAALTNGTQVGDKVITGVAHYSNPTAAGKIYAVGGNTVYPITTLTVGTKIDIDNGGSEVATACVVAGAYAYVFYSKGASGDIAKITVSNDAIDPDWGSSTPTGAAALAGSVNFPAILGGDGIIYFGNGSSVGWYDPVTDELNVADLDFPTNSIVVDLVWERDRLYIAVNNPNISAVNTQGKIYTWDTYSESWEEPVIEVGGKVGGILSKNGTIFVFYDHIVDSRFNLGYVSGDTIVGVAVFSGSLPVFGDYCIWKNHILFIAGNYILSWGSSNSAIPVALNQFYYNADTLGSITSALSNPFVSLYTDTTYSINQITGYATGGWAMSKWFEVGESIIEKVIVYYRPLYTGARIDLGVYYEKNGYTQTLYDLGQIDATNDANTYFKKFERLNIKCSNFCLYYDFTNSNDSSPMRITKVEIYGNEIQEQYKRT